jgi:hypothetical protein
VGFRIVMPQDVFAYPNDWYQFASLRFQLVSRSQVSARPWAGGNSIYGPHAQLWMPKFTATPQTERNWPAMDAFFSRLGGQAGLIRIGDASRLQPQYNTELAATNQAWSDTTLFTDGTGFADGLMPPTCFITTAVARGDNSVIIGGLPASISRALRRGDLFELRPNGIPSTCPNLYQIMVDGHTNSAGETGVEIRPNLRQGMAAGDMVVLSYPTSVFHLVDDSQGEMEITPPLFANFGFSLIEAIENAT